MFVVGVGLDADVGESVLSVIEDEDADDGLVFRQSSPSSRNLSSSRCGSHEDDEVRDGNSCGRTQLKRNAMHSLLGRI